MSIDGTIIQIKTYHLIFFFFLIKVMGHSLTETGETCPNVAKMGEDDSIADGPSGSQEHKSKRK